MDELLLPTDGREKIRNPHSLLITYIKMCSLFATHFCFFIFLQTCNFSLFSTHIPQTHTLKRSSERPGGCRTFCLPFSSLTSSPSSALTNLPLHCLSFPITATCCHSATSRKMGRSVDLTSQASHLFSFVIPSVFALS